MIRRLLPREPKVGNDTVIGIGSEVPNKEKPNVYSGGLATIGENSVIPSGVQIGKNTAISGVTSIRGLQRRSTCKRRDINKGR